MPTAIGPVSRAVGEYVDRHGVEHDHCVGRRLAQHGTCQRRGGLRILEPGTDDDRISDGDRRLTLGHVHDLGLRDGDRDVADDFGCRRHLQPTSTDAQGRPTGEQDGAWRLRRTADDEHCAACLLVNPEVIGQRMPREGLAQVAVSEGRRRHRAHR